jgi:hypothetical protein
MKLPFHIIEQLKRKSGNELRIPSDCELLSLDIQSKTGVRIGATTLKRLLGFAQDERSPHTTTLDVIAHYLGYENWDALRLVDENSSNSSFDDRDEYLACYLKPGQQLVIYYPPNRSLTIEHLDGNRFQVMESENSKLLAGDQLTLTHIVRGYPLLVAEVLRAGQNLGAFTAGKAQGIDFELL